MQQASAPNARQQICVQIVLHCGDAETRVGTFFQFPSTPICRRGYNMIPRKPREGHRETTMSKIMLFVMHQMSDKAGIECLLLQAVRNFRCDKFEHLHQPNAAALIVPGQRTEWTSMKICMRIRGC